MSKRKRRSPRKSGEVTYEMLAEMARRLMLDTCYNWVFENDSLFGEEMWWL